MIKKGDIFRFGVFLLKGGAAALGQGGGPIVN
jgi:hypothetical protein